MCDSTVDGPVIQVTVPAAIRPAMRNISVPSAATSTGGAGASIPSGPKVEARRVSPVKDTCSPSRSGTRIERYSRMCRAGFSKDWPKTFSMTNWWERPITEGQSPAGGRLHGQCLGGQHDRVAGVGRHDRGPEAMPGTSRPMTARAVRAS